MKRNKRKVEKDYIKQINKRCKYLYILIIVIFSIIIYNLFDIIYLKHGYFKDKLDTINNTLIEGGSAPRGRIYDRNYNLLVDNQSKPIIVYKRDNNITDTEEMNLAKKTAQYLDLDYSKVTKSMLKKYYYLNNKEEVDNYITDDEYEKLKRRELTSDDIYNLKMSRISDDIISSLTEEDKKVSYLYYLMNNGYSYSEKIIKETGVTDQEFSFFLESKEYFPGFYGKMDFERVYLYGNTFKTIIGSIGSISKEDKDYYLSQGYSINDKVGTSYLEKQYEDILKGTKAKYKKINQNTLVKVEDEKKGSDIVLTIDINLQQKVDEIIIEEIIKAKSEANTRLFNKSYVIIQQPETGEILAMSGKQVIKKNGEYITSDITVGILTNPMTVGSVVKGASMIVGYNTGAIDIGYTTTDECIKIKSTPKKCSSHQVGRLDDLTALAESSNVYQFKIAIKVGNGNYKYNQPLKLDEEAFDIYRNTFKEFGLGTLTEIDLPNEGIGYVGTKKETNLLLNLSIGQYDSYTPIGLSQYITTIASNGKRLKPHLLKSIIYDEKEENIEPVILNYVNTEEKYLKRVQEGFRQVLIRGTGKNVMGNSPNPAGKTGTSESFMDTNNDGIIDTETVSNAFVGYAPFDNPEMTITVTSPDVEEVGTGINHHSYVNRRIARIISNYYFGKS